MPDSLTQIGPQKRAQAVGAYDSAEVEATKAMLSAEAR